MSTQLLMYYFVPKLLSLLTFLFIFTICLIQKKLKTIIYFTIIYFISKEILNTTYNFTYLNKSFK
jgi:hypothetical protein